MLEDRLFARLRGIHLLRRGSRQVVYVSEVLEERLALGQEQRDFALFRQFCRNLLDRLISGMQQLCRFHIRWRTVQISTSIELPSSSIKFLSWLGRGVRPSCRAIRSDLDFSLGQVVRVTLRHRRHSIIVLDEQMAILVSIFLRLLRMIV